MRSSVSYKWGEAVPSHHRLPVEATEKRTGDNYEAYCPLVDEERTFSTKMEALDWLIPYKVGTVRNSAGGLVAIVWKGRVKEVPCYTPSQWEPYGDTIEERHLGPGQPEEPEGVVTATYH